MLSENFLSVNKSNDVQWKELKPEVISHLNHYFECNKFPILREKNNQTTKEEDSDETIKKIIEVLDTKIRPAVARDGAILNLNLLKKV